MSLYPTKGVCVGVCGVSCMLTDMFESSRVFSCGYTTVVNKLYIYFSMKGREIMAKGPASFRSPKKMIVEGFQYRNRKRNQALYP